MITTVWVKLEALSPECEYTKEDEGKLSITIKNNEKRKTVEYNSDWTKRCSLKKTQDQNQNRNQTIEIRSVTESTSRPEETSMESSRTSRSTENTIPALTSTSKAAPKPCHDDADIEKELSKIAIKAKGPALSLKRWREYDIEVVLEDLNTGNKAEAKTFPHDTLYWICPGNCGKKILQEEFCDGTDHCPGGADESKKNCEVSKLPQKTAYGLYGYMLLIMTIYGMFMISNKKENTDPSLEMNPVRNFEKEDYKLRHTNDNFGLSTEVKEQTFDKIFDVDDIEAKEVCKQVKEAEIEVHGNGQEAYDCVLKHFDGDHPLTARLKDPSGGKELKLKKGVNRKLNSNTKWFNLNISIMFVFLCLHHFDYIKDIGKTKDVSTI